VWHGQAKLAEGERSRPWPASLNVRHAPPSEHVARRSASETRMHRRASCTPVPSSGGLARREPVNAPARCATTPHPAARAGPRGEGCRPAGILPASPGTFAAPMGCLLSALRADGMARSRRRPAAFYEAGPVKRASAGCTSLLSGLAPVLACPFNAELVALSTEQLNLTRPD
jgi:hypothetical protein